MVVKGRKPHNRRVCLCCAEGGALPFSLRRANGEALDDTWTALADDDEDGDAPRPVATPAEVQQRSAPAPARSADSTEQPPPAARGSTTTYRALASCFTRRAGLAVGVVCVAVLLARRARALAR